MGPYCLGINPETFVELNSTIYCYRGKQIYLQCLLQLIHRKQNRILRFHLYRIFHLRLFRLK